MDLASITSALLSLQNRPSDPWSTGAIGAEDGQTSGFAADDASGQDLPGVEAAGAGSASWGRSTAALSAEMQALLLKAQEANGGRPVGGLRAN